MPNTQNFKSTETEQYIRYAVSRVIADKQDDLLHMEVPADFSEKLLQNNIEINLYSLADNSLVFSDFIKNTEESTGAFYTETLQYVDSTYRKLLYIDFAKVIPNLNVPSGRYSITLNFFANELGAYDNRILKVNRISTSRSEVELLLTDKSQQYELEQFAVPGITAEYITPILKQIFNQEGADDIIVPSSTIRIDSSSLYQNFQSGSGEKLLEYNFDDDDESRIGINTITQNVLDIAYPIAMASVANKILSGSTIFTETELSNYVVSAIDEAYDSALNDEEQNPQNYRFDLI